jgi:hypothetical protein
MPSPDSGYDPSYCEFDSPLQRRLREEAYGEDIGQHSWVVAAELRRDTARLRLSRASRLLDLGCGPCGSLTFIVKSVGCRGVGIDRSHLAPAAGRVRISAFPRSARQRAPRHRRGTARWRQSRPRTRAAASGTARGRRGPWIPLVDERRQRENPHFPRQSPKPPSRIPPRHDPPRHSVGYCVTSSPHVEDAPKWALPFCEKGCGGLISSARDSTWINPD